VLTVTYAKCHIKAPYAKFRYAECRGASDCLGFRIIEESLRSLMLAQDECSRCPVIEFQHHLSPKQAH
jgi:hypothetical protein